MQTLLCCVHTLAGHTGEKYWTFWSWKWYAMVSRSISKLILQTSPSTYPSRSVGLPSWMSKWNTESVLLTQSWIAYLLLFVLPTLMWTIFFYLGKMIRNLFQSYDNLSWFWMIIAHNLWDTSVKILKYSHFMILPCHSGLMKKLINIYW